MGILKTAATVAIASSVHGRVQRRQQARWAAQDQAAAAAMPPSPSQAPVAPAASADIGTRLAQLAQLAELQKQGILTPDEFAQQKASILGS